MNQRLRKLFLILLVVSAQAQAAKIDLMAGGFSIDAKTSSGDSNVSTLGSYRAAFSKSIFDRIDIGLGYTLNMENTFGGDMAYGLDIGFNYFPLTYTEPKLLEQNHLSIWREEVWRPYVGLSFNQRQFQSVKNSFAGFGFDAGTEIAFNKKYSFKVEFRYISLGGSSESEATEMNVLGGISFKI